MDLYKYRRRLKNHTSMEGMKDSTEIIINNTFHESPLYKNVFLNGLKTDCRVSFEKDRNERKLLFRPQTELNKGDIVEFDDKHWLIIDTVPDPTYPQAHIGLCNDWLRWTDDNGLSKAYPCVVDGKGVDLNENQFVTYAEGKVNIKAQYNEDTKKLKPNKRFIFNEYPFELTSVDVITDVEFGKGFINFVAELSLFQANDDVDNQIADNETNGWGSW